ncbi:MAG: AAA family ATPase [Sphingobacteriales bacterium JAD_PAG50586_3]|nr:MAG: AAA family ATPase [Sphingobacteriales bacterium JAD_PAG50586_3]
MPINIIHQKKYANGLIDYTDSEGNIIDYTPSYTSEEEYYIDNPPEVWRADALRHEETKKWYRGLKAQNEWMFLLNNSLTLNPSPKERDFTNFRQPLWGRYWAENEMCLLAGDTGSGKTLLALQVAKALAGGCVLGNADNVGKPRKVLYVDFELDKQGFYSRIAPNSHVHDDVLENLHWAGYNQQADLPAYQDNAIDWMLASVEHFIKKTEATVLIIDQPDRLHATPQQWLAVLSTLRKLKHKYGLSIMVVVNTKPHNYARPMELAHIHNHRLLCNAFDSIVGIGVNYNDWFSRYIKPFKIKNRPINFSDKLEGFIIDSEEQFSSEGNHPGLQPPLKKEGSFNSDFGSEILQIFLTAPQDEEDFLKPSKTKLREQKMITAESMRRDGLYTDHIAEELGVPETIIKRWVRGVQPKAVNRGKGQGAHVNNFAQERGFLPHPKPLS